MRKRLRKKLGRGEFRPGGLAVAFAGAARAARELGEALSNWAKEFPHARV